MIFFLFNVLFSHKIYVQDGFLFTIAVFAYKLVIFRLKLIYCIYLVASMDLKFTLLSLLK